MFLVFNKQKIYSYLVALSTVVVLFFVASLYSNRSEEIIQTVSNIKNESVDNQVINQCNNVTEPENKVNEVVQNKCKNESEDESQNESVSENKSKNNVKNVINKID